MNYNRWFDDFIIIALIFVILFTFEKKPLESSFGMFCISAATICCLLALGVLLIRFGHWIYQKIRNKKQ